MVRKFVLVPLLVAANLLMGAAFAFLVVPFVFEIPCPAAAPEDHGSSPAPSPGPAPAAAAGEGEEAITCLRVPRAVLLGISFFFGVLTSCACIHCYNRFADGGEEEDEASGTAKKAGYVAIAADPEPGTGAGGKN